MSGKRIHLIFKTHLDIGFTDHAEKVRRQYHAQFIPQAIATADHFHAENPDAPAFVWTTGAWLIWDHLNSADSESVKRLESAIRRGLITWHALPFTTHSELMSPALFRAGLSFAQELDQRFGRTTLAAKMTDVPGHTLGIVPLLAKAGVKFLHLGVNTASPVPDVPPIFVWRAPTGEEIVVMYQGSYGETDFPAGDDIGLSFAHTSDNIGPQSVGQVVEVLRNLRHAHPDSDIAASTLDAFGALMWARRADFPCVTAEIGDSWIHGAASDPVKLAGFCALQRLYDSWEADLTPARLAFGQQLTLVAEHTWGVDIKTYLRDEAAWDRAAFTAARRTDYRFAYVEQSWGEQRGYLTQAIAQLQPADRETAEAALADCVPPAPPARLTSSSPRLEDRGWRADLDAATGDIARLIAPDGTVLSGAAGNLLAYRHESYDWTELQRHLDSYLQHRQDWAILDHDKPGLNTAQTARTARFSPQFLGTDGPVAVSALPDDAHTDLGAPRRVEFSIRAIDSRTVEIRLILREKPANRMPEAGFLMLAPQGADGWVIEKMGLWHAPGQVTRLAGGQLQGARSLRADIGKTRLQVDLRDAMLVAPATSPFMPYQPEKPDFSAGLRINLYNNKWGTNFPMWWEGDYMARLILSIDSAGIAA